jgi:hypothetical protein
MNSSLYCKYLTPDETFWHVSNTISYSNSGATFNPIIDIDDRFRQGLLFITLIAENCGSRMSIHLLFNLFFSNIMNPYPKYTVKISWYPTFSHKSFTQIILAPCCKKSPSEFPFNALMEKSTDCIEYDEFSSNCMESLLS